ncbi:ATP-binding cassette domain-containing protein [Enterococcus termitis]|uniref:ABC transporter ATP-binding protein n=1 Tax=Enterococcus termitis TaxID=332950 RepID=A0A1E5GE38_9ENTE|nr:ABC transporter ATP-binding protein [Enterococcus termitis]OEG10520.1 hypothetical protein BCR25_08575 [Enterococcus termitis]OJG97512.1 hypothetical protein RV18_GL000793 [Enterococcus termitis]
MKTIFKRVATLILFLIGLSILIGMSDVYFANAIQNLIDSIVDLNKSKLYRYIFLLLGFLCIQFTLNFSLTIVASRLTEKFHILIKQKLVKYLINGNRHELTNMTSSEKLNLFEYDLELYEQYYFQNLISLIQNIFVLGFSLSFLFMTCKLMALTVVIATVLVIFLPSFFGKKIDYLTSQYSSSKSIFLTKLTDIISGYDDIVSFCAEKSFYMNASHSIKKMEKDEKNMNVQLGILGQVISTSQYMTLIACFCVGGFLVFWGEMTLGMLVASVQITNSVIQPSQQLSTSILEIMGSKSIRNKIDQIINTQAIKIDSDIEMTRQVKLDKVSVNSSENKKLLQDIELTFEFGKKYAVIGQSGAGKTSLLNLLAGNYDCYEGEILIDGSLYRKDRGQLNVTYVRQSPYLFKETISKNVTMLSNHQTREINDALIKVAFFSDKNIDEIAVDSLSGGEKQRISIARSYLKKSTFLLLDEISSSLDFQTKQTVMTNICEAMKGTVVFVTHDLSKEVLTLVDQIIVMNNGRIVGMGDYRTLLDSNLLPLASTE